MTTFLEGIHEWYHIIDVIGTKEPNCICINFNDINVDIYKTDIELSLGIIKE